MPAAAEACANLDYLAFLGQFLSPTHQSTSSGAALRGRSSSSTLHPKAFSVPSLYLSLGPCNQRPATGVKGVGTAPWHHRAAA